SCQLSVVTDDGQLTTVNRLLRSLVCAARSQAAAKLAATFVQLNLALTVSAALLESSRANSSSLRTRTTDSAKASGVSAISNSSPSRTGKPSAPMVVEMTGFSIAIAS